MQLAQDYVNRRKTNLIHAYEKITVWCSDNKLRLKEMIKLGTFLYFLNKETTFWEIDKTKLVLIKNLSKVWAQIVN